MGSTGKSIQREKIDIDEIPIPFTFIRLLSLADFLVLDFLSKLLRFLRVTYLHFCIMYYTRYPGGLWLATNYVSKSVLYSSSEESICFGLRARHRKASSTIAIHFSTVNPRPR
jgi:hypothetical protein